MINEIKNNLKNGTYNALLKKIYCSVELVEKQVERYIKAIDEFVKLYGEREIEIYSAPGRSEVGGNHTDHQNGRVLAASINLDAIAIVSKRKDSIVRLTSEGYGEIEVDIKDSEPFDNEKGTTKALVRGVAAAMKKRGYITCGFDGYITSDVLGGSGLSSSAAYEVLITNVLSGMYNDGKIDAITIAQISQEAENIHFGKPCGLLDQMASSVGGLINIDFKDKKKPIVKKIDIDFNTFNHSLCIVDTKGSHADLTDEYAAVPQEMKKVASFFGKEYLSEVEKDEFYKKINDVRTFTGDRAVLRSMHWYAENEKVDKEVDCLLNGEFEEFKNTVKESGNSSFKYLQNVFATKDIKNQSVSLALCLSEEILGKKGVCRVHGGGFAGTIQAFVPNEMVDSYKEKMEKVFGENACYVLFVRPVGGIKIV
ncbi:MAG: galactokinase [Clostridia bacterium]|nr:galactokinase [Clostridia bacterium]